MYIRYLAMMMQMVMLVLVEGGRWDSLVIVVGNVGDSVCAELKHAVMRDAVGGMIDATSQRSAICGVKNTSNSQINA